METQTSGAFVFEAVALQAGGFCATSPRSDVFWRLVAQNSGLSRKIPVCRAPGQRLLRDSSRVGDRSPLLRVSRGKRFHVVSAAATDPVTLFDGLYFADVLAPWLGFLLQITT